MREDRRGVRMSPASEAWLFWAAIVVVTAMVFWAGYHLGYRSGRVDEINDRLERPEWPRRVSPELRIAAAIQEQTGFDTQEAVRKKNAHTFRQYLRTRLDEFMKEREAARGGDSQ